MDVRLLTPYAALLGLAALVPLTVFLLRERRARGIRAQLGLAEPPLRARVPLVLALAGVPLLLGLAAAQPVVDESRQRLERVDAEAYVVVDISRSMLAAADPEAPTRFQRARAAALEVRDAIPEVPVGLASLTDRLLPHSFATTDARVFSATLHRAMGIERPGPTLSYSNLRATTFDSLASIVTGRYFPPAARRRLLVVLTDGESRPLSGRLAAAFRDADPPIRTIFVQLWDGNERIFETGVAEAGYKPDRAAPANLEHLAALVGGEVFAERDLASARAAVRRAVGVGPTRSRRLEGERRALMPWVTLAALVPLGIVLSRRNL